MEHQLDNRLQNAEKSIIKSMIFFLMNFEPHEEKLATTYVICKRNMKSQENYAKKYKNNDLFLFLDRRFGM